MRPLLKWLLDQNRRQTLAFIGSAVAVFAGAAWTAYTFWRSSSDVPTKIEATYEVCVGAQRQFCPPTAVFLRCGDSVAEWATNECGAYSSKQVSARAGGKCGYTVVQIKCTSGK